MRRAALTVALALAACAEPEPRDLDVVLIVLDTLRADHVGCYGYGRPTTPAIDAFAASAVRFADCTAQSSWTGPSMVSLLTSRHVVSDFKRMPDVPTLAETLRAAGWRTAAFQDNPLLAPGAGFERGFDSYDMEQGVVRFEEVLRQAEGQRLFLYCHFVDPHDPYAPEPAFDVFRPGPARAEVIERFLSALREHEPSAAEAELRARSEAAAAEVERQVALYDGDVRQVDRRVEYVLDLLRRHGRAERALVIVAADHGESLWQHEEAHAALAPAARSDPLRAWKRGHNTLLTQPLIHVPLLLAGPGLPQGLVVQEPVENVDIVPTVLELLGLPAPAGLDGHSLLPRIAGEGSDRPAVFANTSLYTAVRTRAGLKLVVPWDETGPDPARAFDLADDPREERPLPPDHPELLRLVASFRAAGLRARADEDAVDEETRARLEALGYVER